MQEDPEPRPGTIQAGVVGDHRQVAVGRGRGRHVVAHRFERRSRGRAAADVSEAVVVHRARVLDPPVAADEPAIEVAHTVRRPEHRPRVGRSLGVFRIAFPLVLGDASLAEPCRTRRRRQGASAGLFSSRGEATPLSGSVGGDDCDQLRCPSRRGKRVRQRQRTVSGAWRGAVRGGGRPEDQARERRGDRVAAFRGADWSRRR